MTPTTNAAPAMTDEQIATLKQAALAATPQDIDGAQRVERFEDGSHIECPACGGEGYVELNSDFCNYDGAALGVQFYGIGDEHLRAEAYFRAAKPATVLALVERLERAESLLAAQPSQAQAVCSCGVTCQDTGERVCRYAAKIVDADFKQYRELSKRLRAACAAKVYGNPDVLKAVDAIGVLMRHVENTASPVASECEGLTDDIMAQVAEYGSDMREVGHERSGPQQQRLLDAAHESFEKVRALLAARTGGDHE